MRQRRGALTRRIWRWMWAAARSSSPERTAASVKPPPAKSPKEVRKHGFVNSEQRLLIIVCPSITGQLEISCTLHQNPLMTLRLKFNQQKGRNSDSYWQMMCSAVKNSHSKFIQTVYLQVGQYIWCAEMKIVQMRQEKTLWTKVKMRYIFRN